MLYIRSFCAILFTSMLPLAWAQFGFFEQMFGQGHPGQQQQRPAGNPAQWAAQADAISCSQYLCPDTLVCVSAPPQCPCPNAEDVRCIIPDAEDIDGATVLCMRGASDCAQVDKLTRKFAK